MLFPAPPRRLRRDYERAAKKQLVATAAITALMVLLAGLLAWWFGHDIRRDRAIWAHGVPATQVTYDGTVSSSAFTESYTLHVSYVDQTGQQHRGVARFETIFKIDYDIPPAVRYAPSNPETFALNVAIEATPSRWTVVLFSACVLPAFVTMFSIIAARLRRRSFRIARQCAVDGKPVVLDLVFPKPVVAPDRKKLRFDYRLARRDGFVHRAFVDFEVGFTPIIVAGRWGHMQILGLQSASHPDAVVVLRNDLFPLEVGTAEAEQIVRDAYEATPDAYR